MIRTVVATLAVAVVAGGGLHALSRDRDVEHHPLRAVGDAEGLAIGSSGGALGRSAPGAGGASDLYGSRDPAPPPAAKRTALIIGINNARGGRPLTGSVTDASNLRDALIAYGFKKRNIELLIDGEASKAAIHAGLDSLARRTPPDGIAVFAVATHTRRRAGQNELLTADGGRITASDLAARLGRVRSRMWIALPTCYAAGYALPGIVGPDRVATFASPKDQRTYQLGDAGSYLFINMVRKAMLEGRAPGSVESAFRFAAKVLKDEAPNRAPQMSDGVAGELVLGRFKRRGSDTRSPTGAPPGTDRNADPPSPDSPRRTGPEPGSPPPAPAPQPQPGVGVCGPLAYNCSRS